MASGSVVSSSLFLIYVAYRLFVGKVLSVIYEEAVGVLKHQLYLYFHSSSACIRRAGVLPSRIWAARSTAVCGCSQAQDVLHKRGAPHPSRVGGSEAIRADPDATPEASPADPPVYRALSTWPACAGIGARANAGCVCP